MTTEALIERMLADRATEVRITWWTTTDGRIIWSVGWERRRPYVTRTGKHWSRTEREWAEGSTMTAALSDLAAIVLRADAS